ncbi:MAG: AsmA family protein [Odoribacteraceae bacterium]|jgi:hypothetical protein|nr:AsmA family protein [Odoribacteraceae bacterium]
MKKFIIITLSVIVLLLGTLVAIPFFFKDDILRLIERQSSKYIQGELAIADVDIGMFRHFPNLSVTLTDVKLTGAGNAKDDTLAFVPRFEASVNLRSLIAGKEVIVNRVLLRDARLSLLLDKDGAANWDILVPSDTDTPAPEEGKVDEGPAVRLNSVVVENLSVGYRDEPGALFAGVKSLSLTLRGNFSESNTLLAFDLGLKGASVQQAGTTWLNNINLDCRTEIGADFQAMSFDVKRGEISLNDLKLVLAGSVAIAEDHYGLDLSLDAPDTRFESLLALLPKEYRHLLDGLETTGEFRLHAAAKGELRAEHLPAIDLTFGIANATLKYKGLPETVEAINLALRVTNPGGSVDGTVVDLEKLAFNVASNPFELKMTVANPSDPHFKGAAKGVIHFESLKRALPLQQVSIGGTLAADLAIDGHYKHIVQEQYEKIAASGHLSLKEIFFKNDALPGGLSIPSGDLKVAPARLDLSNLLVKIGASDLKLEGYIANYLPYILRGGTLKGDFSLASSLLNVSELMGNMPADSTVATAAPAAPVEVIKVPENLQLSLNARVNTLIFDGLTVKNINGSARVNGGVADLKNLGMELLDGKITLNGAYSTAKANEPSVDFDIRAEGIDLHEGYESFSFIRETMPIALNCQGKVSVDTRFAAVLDREMQPVINTINGRGTLSASGILLDENPTLNGIASLFNNAEMSRLSVSNLKIDFNVERGNITIEPFTTKFAGQVMTMYGSQSATGEMNYTVSVNVVRERFGKEIEKVLAPIPGSANIKDVDIDVKIGGTLAKPIITPDFTKVLKSVEKAATDQVKKKVQSEVEKGLGKLFKKK